MDQLKQTKNLFKKLIKDEKSISYAAGRITRTLLNKARKSLYEKDKVFYKYHLDLEDKNLLYESENLKTKIPFYTPFVEQGRLPYTVSMHLLSLYVMAWQIFVFF